MKLENDLHTGLDIISNTLKSLTALHRAKADSTVAGCDAMLHMTFALQYAIDDLMTTIISVERNEL